MARRSSWKIIRKKLTPYKLLIPQIILSMIFLVGIFIGIIQSFGVIPSLGLTKPTIKYYKEILSNVNMINSIVYSFRIAIISALFSTIIGVLISGIIVLNRRENSLYMKIIQLPIIIPHIVVALFTINILSKNGILARVVYSLGLISDQQEFPKVIFDSGGIGVIIAYLWKEIPFIIYFIIALMSKINNKLGEAAINLGASKWKAFFKVTLPLCKNTILSGFIIIFIFALGAYELPAILGATSPRALPVLTYVEYIHPDLQNRPYAMALNGIMILISLISATIYYYLVNSNFKSIKGDINK
ncbi:ABC transporter permease [Miniphocaeibacter massiliensis]|uniref:ABC transporter permease n=1 Tax=Miniphocaeibacter massiliensis TaxID=2041841 RepID=UPI001A9194DB|nr:ABC transporter permease subunit [Miniphocaeibacter massiliensis]